MLDWLLQKRQTPHAIDRFWRQMLVSAVNEDLERMAAIHGFQVFWLGFMARADSYEMGVPDVPLRQLYTASTPGSASASVQIHFRSTVERIDEDGFIVAGERHIGRPLHLRAALRAPGSHRHARARSSSIPPSPACISGSIARSPTCRTPRCSIAPCSGCSTRTAAAICNSWSARRAISDGALAQRDHRYRHRRTPRSTSRGSRRPHC